MKILVFGGTGPTGRLLIHKAQEAGHGVTAYARTPSKLSELVSSGLTIVEGELADASRIRAAMAGQEAVISLLGPSGRVVGTPVADGMRNIVEAMRRCEVTRLVATATPSASDPRDRRRFSFWLAVKMIKTLVPTAYRDIVEAAGVVRQSDLEWTLVRVPMLSDKPAAHPAAAGYVGDRRIKLFSLSRDALAEFLLAQLGDDTWIRAAPAVSNG